MRIAFIRRQFSSTGGAEKIVDSVSKKMGSKGADVYILANMWQSDSDKIKILKIPIVKLGSFFKTLSFALSSILVCKKYRFDIVQSNEKTLFQDIYRADDGCHKEYLEKRKTNQSMLKNFLVSINPFHMLVLYIEKKIFNTSIQVIANSKRVKDEIITHYNTDPKKISIIYNPVDANRYKSNKKESIRKQTRNTLGCIEDTKVILFVGTGFKRKGLPDLLKSLAKINDPNIQLWVVGKGKNITNIYNNVVYVGPDPDPDKYFYAADIFVHPAFYEPFGIVILEAMAFGLGVIVSSCCGGSEVIDDGKDGIVVSSPVNCDDLAEKIKILFDDDRKRLEMGQLAIQKAKQYTLEKNVGKNMKIIQKVIKLKKNIKDQT